MHTLQGNCNIKDQQNIDVIIKLQDSFMPPQTLQLPQLPGHTLGLWFYKEPQVCIYDPTPLYLLLQTYPHTQLTVSSPPTPVPPPTNIAPNDSIGPWSPNINMHNPHWLLTVLVPMSLPDDMKMHTSSLTWKLAQLLNTANFYDTFNSRTP